LHAIKIFKKAYYMSRLRRVVQITSSGVDNVQGTQCNEFTHALCNDGSMWVISNNDTEWSPMPSIPGATEIVDENFNGSAEPMQQLKEAIVLIRAAAHKYLTGLYEFNQFESHLEAIEQRASV
jgi:hypothetical protein